MHDMVLEMEHITKRFGNVVVLNDVDFALRAGEVHALVGANGAGKSTLMKIINGIWNDYTGIVRLNGQEVHFQSPQEAFQSGVAMIHQELDLVPTMDVMGNMFLGRELTQKTGLHRLDRRSMYQQTQEMLDSLGFPIDATSRAGALSAAQQQLLLIARAVSLNAQIIIMDEPTSSLSHGETERLFQIIDDLRKRGKSIIYISHYLEEIFRIADKVTVLRNGEKIITTDISACDISKMVYWMIGNATQMDKKYFRNGADESVVLKAEGLTQKKGIVRDASFALKKGEILGLAGVVGSGRTELVKMVYGAEPTAGGVIEIRGRRIDMRSPKTAVRHKMAFVPEERKTEGLILRRSVFDNIALVAYNRCRGGIIDYRAMRAAADSMIKTLELMCSSSAQLITSLSGGNQQKAVLGRWLTVEPEILILDQPTRGVDVGAKHEIYELMNRLAVRGTSIILISDELEEIINLSDRILVLKKGRIEREIANAERAVNKDELLRSMVG